MDYITVIALSLCVLLGSAYGVQPQGIQIQARPYEFSYTAGRMPNHIDRVHSEAGDGTGVVRGMFAYVDPRQQIRTVEYFADQNGFYPYLTPDPNQETRAVQNAKASHYSLYNQIAADHQRAALERQQLEQYQQAYNQQLKQQAYNQQLKQQAYNQQLKQQAYNQLSLQQDYEQNQQFGYDKDQQVGYNQDEQPGFDPNLLINHPRDTPVVERAKLRHYDLYNKIALEHAKIVAERAERGELDDNGDYDEAAAEGSHTEKVVKIGH